MANRGRGYGEACARCRERKRRCKPGSEPVACSLCENDGVACEISSKRTPGPKSDSRRLATSASPSKGVEPLAATDFDDPSQSASTRTTDIQSRGNTPSTHRNDEYPANRPINHATLAMQDPTLEDLGVAEPGSTAVPDQIALRTAIDVPRYQAAPHDTQPQPDEQLLGTYFAWQCPQLMPVDEQLFRRDMTSTPTGPYYSPLLLYALQAQASRHVFGNDGWSNADKANSLLVSCLAGPPSIPTVQALLVLSGRDLALGQASAGWLKSGMAFRMIDDMKIREEIAKGAQNIYTGELAYLRRRLFWSAYAWDKFFALTLGRRPTFSLLIDDLNELPPTFPSQPVWYPYHPAETFPAYTPQSSLEGEAFFASCLIYQEVERVINRLYQPRRMMASLDEDGEFVRAASARLLDWRRRVPQILLDTAYLPSVSPPPHILTVNILYRVAWILLHRPLRNRSTSVSEAHDANHICMTRSAEINLLFDLHERTFNLRNITYLLAYMAYVTATIDVDEALSGDLTRSLPAKQRLELTLRVLTQASQHTPGIQRSIHHLRQKLARRSDAFNISGTTTPTTAHPSANTTQSQFGASLTSSLNDGSFGESSSKVMAQDLGFEELFASLLPEFAASTSAAWDAFGLDGVGNFDSGELDWMWA